MVTGAAASPDGTRVALRTYADAFELDVEPGGSAGAVVRALGAGTPRRIALPDEPQGESIAYTVDGTALLSVSERPDGANGVDLLRYALPDAPAPIVASAAESPPPPKKTSRAAPDEAEEGGVPVGALAAGGALAAAALVLGLLMARRRAR